jgi:hypothetical protein
MVRTNDHRVFLGRVDPEKVKESPLVRPRDGTLAAVWHYGDGGPPHGGVWGTTGGGKSSLVRMIARGLVHKPDVERRAMTLIDAEGAGEFTMFRRMPGVAQVINMNPAADAELPEGHPTSVQLAAQAIADHVALSTERALERDRAAAAWEEYLVDPAHHQPPDYQPPGEVFLVIDGFATFCYNLRRYLKRNVDTVEDLIIYGRNGRKTDCHLVLADQVSYAKRSKDDTGLPSELKKQLGLRIAAVGPLGITKSEAGMVFDDQDVIPPKELGGCLMKVGATTVPFVVPRWDNATDPKAGLTPDERRAAYRLLPAPVVV